MTRNARRALFYGLIALFLVVGTGVVLYAQGWRFNLENGHVSKIGAIYVRSYPEQASILINGKPTDNTSGFLTPGTLISDLFPGTYAVTLAAPGYETWHENATVLPSFVAQLKYAVLVPQNATTTVSGTTAHFFAAPNFITNQNTAGSLFVNGALVGHGTLESATTDDHAFLFENTEGNMDLYDTVNGTTTNLSAMLQKDGIAPSTSTAIILDPHDGSQIFIMGQNKIWALNLNQQALTLIEKTPGDHETLSPSLAISDAMVVWTRFMPASGTSEVILYDRANASLRETSTTLAGATQEISWINGGEIGILQNDGSLYIYNMNADTAQKIASDVRDFSASQDGTMVAALENTSTEFFTLDDPSGYYRFNLPDVTSIQQLIWYKDDNHLFVVYADHVSFLDLQDAVLTNFTTAAYGTSPVYDQSSNSLYFINPQSELMKLSFPD